MRFRSLVKALSLLLMSALLMGGCAERLGDIDKTRPNVVSKSSLSGDWYFRQMVTDIPYLGAVSAPTIIGSATALYRVRWEIQENFLLAISQDEMNPGKNGYEAGENPEEQIVGKFTILSHFDVRRQFDEQTGEENNVIYEDSSSQKWYERSEMRVDWSRNLAGNSLNFSLSPESNHVVQVESVGDDDPYLIDISEDNITVTSKHAVGYTYGGSSIASSMVTVLTSMLKINPEHDYESVEYPAQVKQRNADGSIRLVNGEPVFIDVFSRYGFFQTVVQEYDQFDGEIWNNRNYRINRFNMWERTFDANGQKIPLQNRTLKPILYFVAEDYPREMMPAAERIGELWNQAFKQALQDVDYPVNDNTIAFAVCDNPVTADSPDHCRAAGEGLKLFGDLRYNFLKLALPAGTVNPLGYGPSSQDVRTGETINAWSVTYYSGLNSLAKRALDMVKMYNGEIDADSIEWLEGDYYEGLQNSLDETFGDSHGHHGHHRSSEMKGAMAEMSRKARDLMHTPEFKAHDKVVQENLFSSLQGKTISQKVASQMGTADGIFSELDDSGFEGFLDNQAQPAETTTLLEALRADTTATINGQILEREEILKRLSENNVYLAEFADPTIAYIASRIAKKYPYPAQGVENRAQLVLENDEKILSELRKAVYVGVMLHEVGHNLGLRHNFSGSTDEMNYIQPGVTTPVVPGDISVNNDEDATQGYWDIATTTNDQSRRLEYQYSSIMDYGAGFASDIHGLGSYDIAAIRFGYLNHIEVYDNSHPLFQQSAQGQYNVIKNRSFFEWDPNNVLFDNNGLEVYQTNNGQYYVNKHEFCTDTFADGFNLSCSRWDVGVDPIEIGFLYGERLREAYWFSNYARGKVAAGWGFNNGLISGIFSRYFNYAARAGILASYISQIYGVNPNEALQGNLAYYHIVAGIGLNEVMNTIMTPDTGCYEWEDFGSTPTLMRSGTCSVQINNHDGAHPRYSHYTMTKEEYSSVSRFGFFNNKIGALLALFRGYGINLEQFAAGEINNRYSSLSLANAFKAETVELLKALMMDTPSRYNALPVQNASGASLSVASAGQQVARVVPSDRVLLDVGLALGDAGLTQSLEETIRPFGSWEMTPKIESNRSDYEFQYGFLYAMMTLRSLYDRTWNNYLSLNQQGDQWGHDFADPSRVVNWADDGTGIIWQAYTFDPVISADGREVDPSIGATFLTFINEELQKYDQEIAANPGNRDAIEDNKRYFLEEVRYRLDFLYNLQNF